MVCIDVNIWKKLIENTTSSIYDSIGYGRRNTHGISNQQSQGALKLNKAKNKNNIRCIAKGGGGKRWGEKVAVITLPIIIILFNY